MGKSNWQPSGFLKTSALIHVGALAALPFAPVAWTVAALAANHALLTAAGLWPRSTLLGTNVLRMDSGRPEIALTIDDGPDPAVTPAVLEILKAHGARATFFCIAEKAAAHPELTQAIADAGHSVENHSMLHRHYFSLLGMRGLKKEISQAQLTISDLTGRMPKYFRAPAGLRNPFLDPVLHGLGLRLVSWTRRGFDTRTGDADLVLKRVTKDLRAGDILLLHDGNAAYGANGKPVILDVLPRLLAHANARHLQFVTLEQGLTQEVPDARTVALTPGAAHTTSAASTDHQSATTSCKN